MKFARYKVDGQIYNGILLSDESYSINLSAFGNEYAFDDMSDFIKNCDDEMIKHLEEALHNGKYDTKMAVPCNKVKFLSPIAQPPHDILCVGVNYSDHLEESKAFATNIKASSKTVYFSKRAVGMTGPGDIIEDCSKLDAALDYEVELAVIIGRRGRNIPRERVEEHIFGYSVFNDFSARTLQFQHVQWYRGKSLDTFSAMGPVIVHKNELPLPLKLNICSRVNGEIRQKSNTELMVADIFTLITELSEGMTLEPGDIIATGTPAGVGMGFKPPRYVTKGDTVDCIIERIGCLTNIIG